jgi:hypothetical protein
MAAESVKLSGIEAAVELQDVERFDRVNAVLQPWLSLWLDLGMKASKDTARKGKERKEGFLTLGSRR